MNLKTLAIINEIIPIVSDVAVKVLNESNIKNVIFSNYWLKLILKK